MTQLLKAISSGSGEKLPGWHPLLIFFGEIGCGFARQAFYVRNKESAFVLCELSEGITQTEAIIVCSDIVDAL